MNGTVLPEHRLISSVSHSMNISKHTGQFGESPPLPARQTLEEARRLREGRGLPHYSRVRGLPGWGSSTGLKWGFRHLWGNTSLYPEEVLVGERAGQGGEAKPRLELA